MLDCAFKTKLPPRSFCFMLAPCTVPNGILLDVLNGHSGPAGFWSLLLRPLSEALTAHYFFFSATPRTSPRSRRRRPSLTPHMPASLGPPSRRPSTLSKARVSTQPQTHTRAHTHTHAYSTLTHNTHPPPAHDTPGAARCCPLRPSLLQEPKMIER